MPRLTINMNFFWPVVTEPPPLAAGDLHVWAVPLDAANLHALPYTEILSPEERLTADQFRHTAPRQRFLIARTALRILLGRYLRQQPSEVVIVSGALGKPRLADQTNTAKLQFNVAHSDQLALIAFTYGNEVGVDVERDRVVRNAEQIAERYFHPIEIAAIVSAPPTERSIAFLKCWTAKEAVLKAIGTGVNDSLAEFYVPVNAAKGGVTSIVCSKNSGREQTSCWVHRLDAGKEYQAAVAVAGPEQHVQCMAFTP